MNNIARPYSRYALMIAILFIGFLRLTHIDQKETSWDVFGYYLPLPATFIYNDPMMNDRSWVEKVNSERQLTGTIYQVSDTEDGQPMYFFLFGMAIFYLPFFLLGHGIASFGGWPADGFSMPYQYALVIGGIVYTIIGLLLLRKILLCWFSETVTAIVLLIVVFATNYAHHLSYKNLETVNILFMLMCWLLWSTIRWHRRHHLSYMLQAGIAVVLMALVKPSEVLAIFIPLLWGVSSRKTMKEKAVLLWNKRRQIVITAAAGLLIVLPQLLYWHAKTGHFIYDSYKNPGIGLDLLHPHLLNVLFSFRKGWLIYTPVMILGLTGLLLFFRSHRSTAAGLLFYFLISFYIICSWTEWWYGAAFSCRPVITSYPILAIGIAAFLTWLSQKRTVLKITAGIFVVLCTALNLFQWWQLQEGIYDPYRTTRAYYAAIFLKTQAPANGELLKSVYRSFDGTDPWQDKWRYHLINETEIMQQSGEWFNSEFDGKVLRKPYREITDKDHAWIELILLYESRDSVFSYGPFICAHMLYREGVYGYKSAELIRQTRDTVNGLSEAHFLYLTPEPRTIDDRFVTYLWNPGKNNMKVHSFRIRTYVRKD